MATDGDPAVDLKLEITSSGTVRVLSAHGRVDTATMPKFEQALYGLCAQTPAGGGVVVDLHGVEVITSSGLRALFRGQNTLADAQAQLGVSGVRGLVAEVFQVAKVGPMLSVHPDVDTAVAAITSTADQG